MLSGKFSIDLPRRYRASKPTHLTEIMHYLIKKINRMMVTSLAPHPTVFPFLLLLSVSIILGTEFTLEPKFTESTVLFTSPATLLI